MRIPAALAVAAIVTLATAGPAGAQTTRPTTAPTLADIGPEVREILRRLEAAGEKSKTLAADVVYRVTDRLTGDEETRTGWVRYQGAGEETPAKFRVHFETLKLGHGRKTLDRVDYAFDGKWFTIAKHRSRQMIKSQVSSDVKPFDVGQGYFPLPFGQQAEEVVKHFEVTTRRPKDSDPNDTDYLQLDTRKRYRRALKLLRVELWVDRKTHLPVRIRSIDTNRKTTTVTFQDLKRNEEFDSEVFNLPRRPGWSYHVERLGKKE